MSSFDRISHPAMTDLSIDWGDMQVTGVYPSRLGDLFVGRPVIATGRFTPPPGTNGAGPSTITVTGNIGGRTADIALAADPDGAARAHKGLPAVWARMKIADLADRSTYEGGCDGGNELAAEVRQVALEFGLMSAYTAFVAVDSLTRTAGDHGTTVPVPVPVPVGVKYETTVDE